MSSSSGSPPLRVHGAYEHIANDITLCKRPEQMCAESAILVGSGAADRSRKLNVGFKFLNRHLAAHAPTSALGREQQLPVLAQSGLLQKAGICD